jgi:hypothetical protein
VPYLFWGVYKVLYPFIDPIVREKVKKESGEESIAVGIKGIRSKFLIHGALSMR